MDHPARGKHGFPENILSLLDLEPIFTWSFPCFFVAFSMRTCWDLGVQIPPILEDLAPNSALWIQVVFMRSIFEAVMVLPTILFRLQAP